MDSIKKNESIMSFMNFVKILIPLLALIAIIIAYGYDARNTNSAPKANDSKSANSSSIGGIYAQKLKWEVPQKRTDGTALTDIKGFHIYFGTISGMYTKFDDVQDMKDAKSLLLCQEIFVNGKSMPGKKRCEYTVKVDNKGVYYFAVTAYDDKGNESDFSNEVRREVNR